MKLTPEQLLELAARAPLGDLCILRHPEHPDGLHDIGRRSVQWALDLVAAVNEAMPEDAQTEPEVYPWAEHPDLKWMATDLDGSQWGYSADAAPRAYSWAALDEKGVMRFVDAGSAPCPHWRETKRRRPEGV